MIVRDYSGNAVNEQDGVDPKVNSTVDQSAMNNTPKRTETPPPQEPEADVLPPSPPPGDPSKLAVALAGLADLTARIEFQYARHLLMGKEHRIIKAKIETLKNLPVGIEAVREDLKQMEEMEKCYEDL